MKKSLEVVRDVQAKVRMPQVTYNSFLGYRLLNEGKT